MKSNLISQMIKKITSKMYKIHELFNGNGHYPMNNPAEIKCGFYKRELFNIRLREERRRADRSGSPLSMIIFDVSKLVNKQNQRGNRKLKHIMSEIVFTYTREIDIKSWYDDNSLKIILSSTKTKDAKIVAERILDKMNDCLMNCSPIEKRNDSNLKIVISSYPEII